MSRVDLIPYINFCPFNWSFLFFYQDDTNKVRLCQLQEISAFNLEAFVADEFKIIKFL
jgi:hypothetical protein